MDLDEARTLIFKVMVSLEWFRAFNACSDGHTVLRARALRKRSLFLGFTTGILLQVGIIYLPPLQEAFKTVSPAGWQWCIALGVSATLFTVENLRKISLPRLLNSGKWEPWDRRAISV